MEEPELLMMKATNASPATLTDKPHRKSLFQLANNLRLSNLESTTSRRSLSNASPCEFQRDYNAAALIGSNASMPLPPRAESSLGFFPGTWSTILGPSSPSMRHPSLSLEDPMRRRSLPVVLSSPTSTSPTAFQFQQASPGSKSSFGHCRLTSRKHAAQLWKSMPTLNNAILIPTRLRANECSITTQSQQVSPMRSRSICRP